MLKYLAPALVALSLVVAMPVAAHNHNEVKFTDNKISADVNVNGYDLQLSIGFAQAIGLNPANVEVSIQVINPNDHHILNRLPDRYRTAALGEFPLMISVKPRKDRGFAFTGEAQIELYTTSIDFADNIRLFRSHDGGTFEDITSMTAPGSLRARGSAGTFSDFILLADNRDAEQVAVDKAVTLANYLQAHIAEFDTSFGNEVLALSRNVANHVNGGRYQAAVSNLNAMLRAVERSNADALPNIWRSSDDIVNVQGEVLTKGRSLRFTLTELVRK